MRSKICKGSKLLALVLLVVMVLSGCKATVNLSIEVSNNASGNLSLSVILDENAARILRSDAYKPSTISELFSLESFSEAGYKVRVEEDPLSITLYADFTSEEELRDALRPIASPEILNATLDVSNNLFFDKTKLVLDIDLSKLRRDYLENEEVRSKVQSAGIEFEDFREVIEEAFASTRVNIELKAGKESTNTAIITEEQEVKTAEVSSSEVRTHFLLNIGGATLSLIAAALVLWGIRRRRSLVSYEDEGNDFE